MAEINTWPGWECVRQLGAGSFGKVYEIERTDSGKTYKAALKVITIPQNDSEIENAYSTGMDEEAVTQYFRSFVTDVMNEIALMADLKGYTNIVSYEDHMMVEHEGKIGWDILIRMELLTPLQKWAAEHPLSESDVIKLGCDMCKALELCHKSKIIHRDIKPQNIFVNKNGDFKLGDFGIARVVEKTNSVMSQKGTYTYMAPEVFQGRNYNETADIYSLGIVLYRFLNHNRTPFLPMGNINYHDQQAAQDRRMSGETVPEPALGSSKLKQAVVMTLQYEPEKRVQSAVVLNRILEQCKAAVSMDGTGILQPQKTSEVRNIPKDIAASVQPKMESEGVASFQPKVDLEGTLPIQPKVDLEGSAPVQPQVDLEGTAPVQPKVNLEGSAPVQPQMNLKGTAPVQPKTDFSGIVSGWLNEDMEAASAAPVVDTEATTRVGANRTGAETALNRSQKKKKTWIIGVVAAVLLVFAIVGAIAEKSAQEEVNSRLEMSEASTETNQPSGTESDGLIPQTQTTVTEENNAEQENGTSSELELDMYFSLLGDASILLMHEDAKVPFTWELPMQVQMVLNEGWTSTMGAEESLEPGFYNRIFEKDGAVLCVSVENPSSSALPIEECTVIAMEITDDDGLYVGLKGGIDFDSTENEIINVYGTPDFTHTEEGYTFMSYTRDSGTVHFAEGPMDGIFLLAPGYSFNEDNVFYTNLKNNNNQ